MKRLKKKHVDNIRDLYIEFQRELGLVSSVDFQLQNIKGAFDFGNILLADSKKSPKCFAWISTSMTIISLEKVLFIKGIFVEKESRGKGLGSELMKAIKAHAKENKIKVITGASRNKGSEALLKKHGGVVDETHYRIEVKSE